jgi:tetratricopeptide (TPR) repeat protein
MTTADQLERAYALHRGGDIPGAVNVYRMVLLSDPKNFDAWFLCAMAEAQRGHLAEALQGFEQALAIRPGNADALNAYGHALMEAGRFEDAIGIYRKAVAVKPANADELNNLGNALSKAGRHDEALVQFDAALKNKPDVAVGHYNRGVALSALDRKEEAILAFGGALRLQPDFAEAANNIGMAQMAMGRDTEAVDAFRQAVKAQPGYARGWVNLGRLLAQLDELDEAIECLTRAVEIDPENANANFELGRALMPAGRPREAAERFRGALALEPNHNDAAFNLSLALLLLGKFDEAWPLYDYRLRTLKLLGGSARVAVNQDSGGLGKKSDLAGDRLLVLGEQGLGDEIMFSSVLPDILRVNPNTTLIADARLVGLFERSFPGLTVCAHPPDDGGAINQVPVERRYFIGSLMKVFRQRLDDFPGTPYLVAEPTRRAAMRARLDALGRGAKIGIMWRGGVGGDREHLRSLALEDLAPLLEEDGIHWISLSHLPQADDETAAFTARTGIAVHHWPEVLRSFDYDDTAALLAELDAVVSVTGTVAHCAAALGVPAHVLVNRAPEWRYAYEGAGLPWYGAMNLYRQTDAWPLAAVARTVKEIGANSPKGKVL